MSEKQFVVGETLFNYYQIKCEKKDYSRVLAPNTIVKLLNEQQATIDKLDQENADLLGARIREQEEWEKCTDKLKEKIVEQQATIRKLQDLCGQSDGENAKLRIENKRLQEEIERLQKIIDLTSYQLKVQDRILKEVGE